MDYQGVSHSKLVQRKISSNRNVDGEFAKIGADGSIPIVLVPPSPMLFSFALAIPSGPFVLYQKWHVSQGQLNPGMAWFRVSHIVSRAVITYDAPAQKCPTADNVLVDVDLSLTFRIGPDADTDAAANVVYRLGAHRFDELLSVQTEEAIRGLVYSVTHDRVNDLREEFALGILTTLNLKASRYGVQIMNVKITDCRLPRMNVKITDCRLPRELQLRLERTTAFKTKLSEQSKQHENAVRVLEDEAITELDTIRKPNDRRIQELQAELKKYMIQRRKWEEKARGETRVEQVQAKSKAEVAQKQAKGDDISEMVKPRQAAEALLKRTDVETRKEEIMAEQEQYVKIRTAEAALKSSEANAAALIAQAEAEAAGAESLAEKRKYELEWARLAVLEKLAGKGKGDAILSDLIPAGRTL
jgi:regulator of protease activity HflC (stomatin/prohibitin superfamily)